MFDSTLWHLLKIFFLVFKKLKITRMWVLHKAQLANKINLMFFVLRYNCQLSAFSVVWHFIFLGNWYIDTVSNGCYNSATAAALTVFNYWYKMKLKQFRNVTKHKILLRCWTSKESFERNIRRIKTVRFLKSYVFKIDLLRKYKTIGEAKKGSERKC